MDVAALARQFIPAVILLSVVFLPIFVMAQVVLTVKRRQARDERRSPINIKLLHQAGAQARIKSEDIKDRIMERLVMVLLIGPLLLLAVVLPRMQWAQMRFGWLEWSMLAAAVAFLVAQTIAVLRLRDQRRKWVEGMQAEMAVAQELNGLQAMGCQLVHDLPADGFNIDHVVVGASAVFAVETKSRRKSGPGRESAQVKYDGKHLAFPGWPETKPLEQARAQARWLADYLSKRTGEGVVVLPVVCLPGWYVIDGKDAHRSDVRVINPKMTMMFTEAGRRSPLQPAQRNRILNALHERFPDAVNDG